MLAAKRVITLIPGFVGPSFNTFAMLQVVLPHSFVLCAIDMLVDTRSVRLVVRPEAIVNIAVHMRKSTLSMCSVFTPFTLVPGTIRPHLDTLSITEATLPLTRVHCTSLKSVRWAVLARLVWIVKPLCHSFACLFLREVLAATKLLGLKQRNQSTASVTAPPGLELDDVLYISLQVAVIVFVFLLQRLLAVLVCSLLASTELLR